MEVEGTYHVRLRLSVVLAKGASVGSLVGRGAEMRREGRSGHCARIGGWLCLEERGLTRWCKVPSQQSGSRESLG
jgi:hypothetical protein